MADIFIVEDDPVIAREMDNFLTSWGHNVKCAQYFKNVTAEFADFNPQLVLLDISLPFFNGYCRCREIRKLSDVPIIFISSAADNMNIVTAVNMGGDDFLAKPFDLSVLNAKVQAILRRTYELSGAGNLKEHRGAVLNKQSAAVSYRGKSAELTKKRVPYFTYADGKKRGNSNARVNYGTALAGRKLCGRKYAYRKRYKAQEKA